MATSSVSGLGSGLDTASIVSQLMAIERNSQTLLKGRLTTEQSNVKSLQDINSKLSALATSAGALAKPTSWNPVKVTTSSEHVTAAATPGAMVGALSFTVEQRAQAHTVSLGTTAKLTDPVVTGDGTSHKVQLTRGGTTVDIDAGDGTLQGLVNGINAAGTGLKAGLVKVDTVDGAAVYRLRVTSATTGEDGVFTLSDNGADLLGGATVVTQGQNAAIKVGSDVIESASNTFAGVLNGVDVTLGTDAVPGTSVDLSIERDSDAMVTSIKELVDAVNTLIADMDKATAYSASGTSTRTGTLAGDSQVRSVRNDLLTAVYPTDGSSMAAFGIQTDRYGKLVLDETKLKAAIADDPAKVAAAFTSGTPAGFAERVQKVAKGASDPVDGTITAAVNGRNSTISRLQDSIDDWDDRLALREQTLTRQFTAMETALSRLNGQSAWLGSQISSLSSGSDS